MPFILCPHRRFPIQCAVSYKARPFQGKSRTIIPQILSVLIVAFTAVGASGCATPGSGIVEIADDTYMHSKFGSMLTYSGSEVKAELYKEANQFCAAKGKKLEPLNSTSQDSGIGTYASAEIQFKCL